VPAQSIAWKKRLRPAVVLAMAAAYIAPLTTDLRLGWGLPAAVGARFAAVWGTVLFAAALAAAGLASASLLSKSPPAAPTTSLTPASTLASPRP